MPPRKAPIHLGPGLTPREHAMDAVNRFVGGLEDNDEDLLRSAFVDEAILDLTDLSRCTGTTMSEIVGLDAIVKSTLAQVGPLESGHHLSNVRVKLDSNLREAEVSCLAIAQHKPAGRGADLSIRGLVFGNQYWADVTKCGDGEEALWKIRRLEMRNLWLEGDREALA